jgi:hypothetical protein
MKKLVLIAALSLTGAAAFGQGQFTFNNQAVATGTGPAPIFFDSVASGVKVSGTQARTALIAGPAASATPYTLQQAGTGMMMGNFPGSSTLTWVTFRTGTSTSSGAGFVSVGATAVREFSNVGFGVSAIVQVVAWTGNYTDWAAAWTAAQVDPTVKIGMSSPLTLSGGNPPTTSPTALAGLTSFALTPVPEPATAAIIGMGLASLLVFRRRK